MNNPPQKIDELFELELQIAQRADELVRLFGPDPMHALKQWRQAEREVLHVDSRLIEEPALRD